MRKGPRKIENLPNLIKKEHEGKWVAISEDYDEIVDFSDTLVDLEKKIGSRNVIYMKAAPSNISSTLSQ